MYVRYVYEQECFSITHYTLVLLRIAASSLVALALFLFSNSALHSNRNTPMRWSCTWPHMYAAL